jgi:predicted nucleic acid-binding protein
VDLLVALVSRPNVRVLDMEKDDALVALTMCRPSNRVSIADALIWATARRAGASVDTLDRRFPRDRLAVRLLGP